MKILVLNCGSSSLKYQLIDMTSEDVLASGLCERIGIDGRLVHKTTEKYTFEDAMPTHQEAIKMVIDALLSPEHGVISDISEINAVGHRVVHGGEQFAKSVVVTEEVIKGIEDCCELAPLHNPVNLMGIKACENLMPGVKQVAVFDTAFHQTMPKQSYIYGTPYELYEKHKVRRYGFHGTSHMYVSQRAAEVVGQDIKDLKIITCHLGNGGSVAAVNGGECMDTSMGFTPLEGLVMGTRCGDMDPAIVPFVMQKEGLDLKQVDALMNKESGVLGISGVSSDFRDLEDAAEKGNERAALALDIFHYRVAKYIGQYLMTLKGADLVVFTAGLGENSGLSRSEICKYLEWLGVTLDADANSKRGQELVISTPDSKIKVLVIPTNEEIVIARDTKALLG